MAAAVPMIGIAHSNGTDDMVSVISFAAVSSVAKRVTEFGCVIRAIPTTDSDVFRPPIPAHSDH